MENRKIDKIVHDKMKIDDSNGCVAVIKSNLRLTIPKNELLLLHSTVFATQINILCPLIYK